MIKSNLATNKNCLSEPVLLPKGRKFRLTPATITKILSSLTLLLLLAHCFTLFLTYYLPNSNRVTDLLNRYFNFNNEANFPTFFASIILLFASGLLFYIYKVTAEEAINKGNKHWFILSAIFLFLCFDEATMIHDELVLTVRNRLPDLPGIFYYAWVIPYSILFLAIAVYFMQFVLSLPPKTRNLFFLSGFIYVFGAVGFELIEGSVEKFYKTKEILLYDILITIEELLELVGINIFIYALLDYMAPFKAKLMITQKSEQE